MNLLLNASNIRSGSSVAGIQKLIRELVPLRTEDHFYLVHPQGVGYEPLSRFDNLTLLPVSERFHTSYLSKIRFNEFVFKGWCRDYSIHKIISLGNVACRSKAVPQLLYIQNAFLAYPDSPAWKQLSWKSFLRNSLMDQWAAMHLRYATVFAVQTDIMKERLVKRFEMAAEKVHVIPVAAADDETPAPMRMPGAKWKLLFLSEWYPHKNFECLIPLAEMIKDKALPVTITLTLDRSEGDAVKALLAGIKEKGLDDILINAGRVESGKTGAMMAGYDALFLPSFLETFAMAYAEALRCGRPIFTSHYDFAVTALGDAAWFFDPLSTESIYKTLEEAWADRESYAGKAAAAATLGAQMPSWPQIAALFSEVIDTFA